MQPTLDCEVIGALQAFCLNDGTSLAHQLIAIFLDVTPCVIDDLCSACLRRDAKTAARLVSRLCGSSSCLGGIRFAQLCGELTGIPLHEQVSITLHLNRIRDEYIHLERALHAYVRPHYALSYSA